MVKQKITKKDIILISIIIVFTIVTIIIIQLVINKKTIIEPAQDDVEITDELMRAKYFVTDWYSEISQDNAECRVFLNELRFNDDYTLTYFNNRIRAVYPRGERFFKLELITSVEFFSLDGAARCRFKYGTDGEWTFRLS